MLILLLFLICSSFQKTSFKLMTSYQKEFTLEKPDKYLSNSNFFKSLYKKVLGINEDDNESSHWYYVYFLDNDISKFRKNLHIENQNKISKNTYALFLPLNQVEQLKNAALIKKIESSDKFYQGKIPIESTDKLIISTASNYQLIPNSDLYTIENKKLINSYIIKIHKYQNDDAQSFNERKKKVIQYLSEIPEIKLISTFKKPELKNSIISGFTQKNSFEFESIPNLRMYYADRYLNRNGLKGENQVITIVDTPLDIYHAMFRDDNFEVEINKTNLKHRKIIHYHYHGTKEDLEKEMNDYEHGTHVSGTAAGKSICPFEEMNYLDGNAPEAKIFYAGDWENAEEYLDMMNELNSTISSNSWGSTDYSIPDNYYGNYISLLNPQSVFIFAGGNEYQILNGNFSVCDPGGSKNVLTVGAIDDFYKNNARSYYLVNLDNQENIYGIQSEINVIDPIIIGNIVNDPSDTINILGVNLTKGPQCDLLVRDAVSLGYGKPDAWINSCEYGDQSQIFLVGENEEIQEWIKDGARIELMQNLEIDQNKRVQRAVYSSTGPGYLGILKPDVMAVGTSVVSAKSKGKNNKDHGCFENIRDDIAFMSGTSMATPNVAGGMALVHQYFNSGHWIENVDVDGSTSRALIINSAKHPLGSKTPDIIYGHGSVDLSTIIPIKNEFGVQITRQGIKDEEHKHSLLNNGHVVARLKVDSTKYTETTKLQITMSYNDQILSMDSIIPIIRDLDMIVVSPSKKVFTGDHLANGDTQHSSTNEKVIIDEKDIENGVYMIHVYGGVFTDNDIETDEDEKRQLFSVVASGPIDNGYLEFADSDECPCEKCDPDRPGFCLCENNDETIGQLCQIKIDTFDTKKADVDVDVLQVKRIRFHSDKKIKSVLAKSEYPGRYATVWISEKCHLSLGEYTYFGETGYLDKAKETVIDGNTNDICVAIFNDNDLESTYSIEIVTRYEYYKNKIVKIVVPIVVVAVVLIVVIVVVVICVKKGKCSRKGNFDSLNGSDLINSSD